MPGPIAGRIPDLGMGLPIAAELPLRGLNPLVGAAAPLLRLASQLRSTLSHPDPASLRNRVVDEVKAFESRARGEGLQNEVVLTARYLLCTLLDESVLATPWGSTSVWSKQGLLISFHREAWGGEKFFVILEHLLQNPAGNLHLLELIYLCLALGFQGRYHVQDRGVAALEDLREQLYRVLRQQRGDFERELSPHWRGVVDKRSPLVRILPLWVLGAVAAALLVLAYAGFSYALNRASDPVFAQLHQLGRLVSTTFSRPTPPPVIPPKPAPPPPLPRLRTFLAEEIRAGLVDVYDQDNRSTVIIHGDGLFPSGSAAIKPNYFSILERIAEALAEVPGQVLVIGHTDNVAIRSVRFPSNWHLSQERALAVLRFLGEKTGTPGRFRAEGRGDTEPLVANDSAENRARNRRVEITLIASRREQ